MPSVITKGQKYELHNREVRGILRPPHDTNSSCNEDKQSLKEITVDIEMTHSHKNLSFSGLD